MNVDWRKPWPNGLLLSGLVFLVLAIVGTFTGKAYGKGGSADRATEPLTYWLILLVEYLGAAFLIWSWLNTKSQ